MAILRDYVSLEYREVTRDNSVFRTSVPVDSTWDSADPMPANPGTAHTSTQHIVNGNAHIEGAVRGIIVEET